jgi:hypothetical protein
MGLIITPLLMLLVWDEVEKKVENYMINLAATQEPLYVEDVNRPIYDMDPLIKEQKDGKFSPRVYPYSVVDGGVHSVQELRLAIWRDPVVAKHYSNFKLDGARVIEAKADGDFYVSYRIGKEIFWTKKRLKVAKGERLITDGTTFTRTRCANVLSEVPQGKTLPDEPTPEVLNTPTLPPSESTLSTPPVVTGGGPAGPGEPMREVLNTPTLPASEPTPFTPPVVTGEEPPATTPPQSDPTPFIPPVVIGGGPPAPTLPPSEPTPFIPPVVPGGGPPDPAVPVPEPTTMLLLGSGLLGLWGLRKKIKK